MSFLDLLDPASVAVFSLTGALVASRAQLDLVGFLFIAALTSLGGGTVRDLLLDRPVFWMAEPWLLAIPAAAAALVFLTAHFLESRYRTLRWLDACALAAAVPAGVGVALLAGQGGAVAVVMGILTGCLGGLLRDVVCNEVPLVLKQGELYVTAAFAGALVAVLPLGLPPMATLAVSAALTFTLRAGSLAFGWRLPVYRARPPADGPPRRDPA
jgi:uncharacterized membrane protein YeiH